MSSGGGKTQTTTASNDPPAWATDYFKQNLQAAGNLQDSQYQVNPYTTNRYANQQVGQLTGDITQQFQNGVMPSLEAQFQTGGAFGGTAHQQAMQGAQNAFAHQLAEASTGIRSQNADQQRQEFQRYQDYAGKNIGIMSSALAAIRGGTSSQTGANPNYTSAGQNAASYAATIASLYNAYNGG